MPIQLTDDEPEPTNRKHPLTRLANSVRCFNIPLLNFLIILILGTFLYKLTTKYTNLYMKSSLITIIVTNLVLYGISESLAQSILSYRSDQPMISFKFNDPAQPDARHDSEAYTALEQGDVGTDEDDVSIDDQGLDRFIEYLRRDQDGEEEHNRLNNDLFTYVPLTYFQFNRLAGFMCWGFIMSFVQCWWYKFLQVYSKDPKFIEVLRKVMTDQFCFSPISLFCFFTYGTMVLENGTWEDTKKKLGAIYLKTLMINYSVWFPIQFINFLIVPRDFQVPFSSSISVLWNCFLSMRNSTN
ncbi:hypothetical protein CANMA_000101 [Candida margitis]|uniref:uncharacterized protein n=1 Tax=Candida margitis TaxID=1775924 RepID=UPI00222752A4|nr:uncharacterized protein CANMA_000101 [Candida margitis]KAI5970941.1 hypothetical protein CANMA_000101 [Candida margitis]